VPLSIFPLPAVPLSVIPLPVEPLSVIRLPVVPLSVIPMPVVPLLPHVSAAKQVVIHTPHLVGDITSARNTGGLAEKQMTFRQTGNDIKRGRPCRHFER
jgi:hypothetical protein